MWVIGHIHRLSTASFRFTFHNDPSSPPSRPLFSPPFRSHLSSFFGETNSSSIPLAYELRLLELEERVLKLEGLNAKASKYNTKGGTNAQGVEPVRFLPCLCFPILPASGTFSRLVWDRGIGLMDSLVVFVICDQVTLPYGEQLLLGCTFAGACVGLLFGQALLRRQMYIGYDSGSDTDCFDLASYDFI
jgi:hypothetical protein